MESKKGFSNLVAAVLLLLIAAGVTVTVSTFGRDVVETLKNPSEEKAEQAITRRGTSFYIYQTNQENVTIKNNGKNNLNASSFSVYLNDSLESFTPTKNIFGPGDNVTLMLTKSTNDYIVEVSGPFGKSDEVVGQVVITTTSTSTSTSTSSSTSTSTSTTTSISPTYFDDWTSDNTGDWTHSEPAGNHYQWWLDNGQDFTSPKEFEMGANLLDWDCGGFDHTIIGWTADKSSYYRDVEHVSIYWEHKDSTYGGPCTDNSEVLMKLHLRNSGSTYTTSLKSFPQPSSSDNIRVILSYTSNTVSYEIKNLDTGSVLASDSIIDSSKIPSPSSTKYLFFQAFDVGGGIFNYNSPTYINWGNSDSNGGMEWRTDYWSVEGI